MANTTVWFGGARMAADSVPAPDGNATDNVLKVQVVAGTGSGTSAALADNADGQAVSATTNASKVVSRNTVFNGTSWDRQRKASIASRVASSAAAGNPAVAKATAGDLRGFWGQNGAAITYLQIYSKATAPVIGTDTPILTFPIAASSLFSVMIPEGGFYVPAGIGYAFTTDAAGTTAAAAAAVTAFALLAA